MTPRSYYPDPLSAEQLAREVAVLRVRCPNLTDGRTDQELRDVLAGAYSWIAGCRYATDTVAANYLRDGTYHT